MNEGKKVEANEQVAAENFHQPINKVENNCSILRQDGDVIAQEDKQSKEPNRNMMGK